MVVETESNLVSAESPVPSITLSITQDDVKRVLEASEAIEACLESIQPSRRDARSAVGESSEAELNQDKISQTLTPSRTVSTSDSSVCSEDGDTKDGSSGLESHQPPLHEMIYRAVQQCKHPMLTAFLEKMKASGSSAQELRAGILVFHDLDLVSKVKLLFDVLGDGNDTEKGKCLSRDGALSLFRSVIVAISSCIHREKQFEIEMEQTAVEEPPTKRRKMEQGSPSSAKSQANSSSGDSIPALQSPSPSFDSSLATLKEEDDFTTNVVRKEFEEIAIYATDRLIRFHSKSNENNASLIPFETFEEWRKVEGAKIAPWLELLGFDKWKPPSKSTVVVKEEVPEVAASPDRIKPPSPADRPRTVPPKVELPVSMPRRAAPKESPAFQIKTEARTVVSFDFTGADDTVVTEANALQINITEDNLNTLADLVQATGLANRPIKEVTGILLSASKPKDEAKVQVIPIERFHTCLHQLLGSASTGRLTKPERDIYSSCFVDFFSCFDTRLPPLDQGEVDATDLAVGFCFLAAGSKSVKLAAGFDLLQSDSQTGLTTDQLSKFLRSYLTMLCGLAHLTGASDGVMKPKLNSERRKSMLKAVENGARWTLTHFLESTGRSKDQLHTFEVFAGWYTDGGFNIAPWLELLDLSKLLSLVHDIPPIASKSPQLSRDDFLSFPTPKQGTPTFGSPRRSRQASDSTNPFSQAATTSPEVLFTFPLANRRSLVVLREDATYVRGVVDQLGLLSMTPDEVWTKLHSLAKKHPALPNRGMKSTKGGSQGKSMPVSKPIFVECMLDTIKGPGRKRYAGGHQKTLEARDILSNLFQSFDLLQTNRVALNELMGGLTLLCGGKKSTKLAFAFGVYDQRPAPKSKKSKKNFVNSLGGEDLFLFLRSFLIVMFSCCRQSWDLSNDSVNRYIADTANMVTEDVMKYQWKTRKRDRVDFDEFGQWYNEGGFETAPWLELLDLRKWVLVDASQRNNLLQKTPTASPGLSLVHSTDTDCPPPPPDHEVDASFFDDDANHIMPMDSLDEMDILLMQPSQDKENDADLNKLARTFSYSPKAKLPPPRTSSALKFHLITEDDHGGYVVSVSQKRIRHLRQVLTESGLCQLSSETACREILAKCFRDQKSKQCLTKDMFDSAMRSIVSTRSMSKDTQRTLSDILGEIFVAFDHSGTGRVNALEVACGFTVLCNGKKSDKLEYAFEVLDKGRTGKLSEGDTTKYLRSFLTVLLNIVSTKCLDSDSHDDSMSTTSGMRCERTSSTMARAVDAGSSWASGQAFGRKRTDPNLICFDEFAEWYTDVGYSNIPWLELLDLQKWVITDT